MFPLVVASNMFNEMYQVEEWLENVRKIADGGILIVDTFSTDGTYEFFKEQSDVTIVQSNIILDEGYGPARNNLRELSKQYYPNAHWMMYLDGDERIDESDFHKLRFIKDYLRDTYDVVALPRIDWMDKEKSDMAKDWHVFPDWQARMTRLNSSLYYVRKLHEQIVNYKNIYTNLNLPKLNHYHRSTSALKRDYIGRVCSVLHREDEQYGDSYPKHAKEDMYYEQYLKSGLHAVGSNEKQ